MPSLYINVRNILSMSGVVLTFVALAAANAEVASSRAPGTLRLALVAVVAAEYCWARLLWSEGRGGRAAFFVLSAPNAFVLVELAMRARTLLGR
jgi:hypothetical protein